MPSFSRPMLRKCLLIGLPPAAKFRSSKLCSLPRKAATYLAPRPVDDLAYCIDGERSLALADKYVGRLRVPLLKMRTKTAGSLVLI